MCPVKRFHDELCFYIIGDKNKQKTSKLQTPVCNFPFFYIALIYRLYNWLVDITFASDCNLFQGNSKLKKH